MAYGSTISRGIIGDPSAQARGKRLGFDPKKEKEKKQKTKEPKDVPLRKWDDHQKIMKDMAKKLKEAKKAWREEDDPTRKAELKEIWRRGNESYTEVSNTLQNMRNNYQSSWEEHVADLQEKQGSDIYKTEEGGFFNRKYPTAAENYRNLRGGGNMSLADSWQVGETPTFNFATQKVDYDDPAFVGEEKIDQWEVTGIEMSKAPMPLDAIPMVIDPSAFKFGDQSYADTAGATAQYTAQEVTDQFGNEISIERRDQNFLQDQADRGADEERRRMGLESQQGIYGLEDEPFNQRLFDSMSRYQIGETPRNVSWQGSGIAQATGVIGGKDGLKTKRKKYDIDGNRID